MPPYRMDLHVHSPASSCFSGEPDAVYGMIRAAKNRRLDIIAITDHHSIRGFEEVRRLSEKERILVLPGLELTCSARGVDEVFILAVFDGAFKPEKIEEMLFDIGVTENAFGHGGFTVPRALGSVIEAIKRNNGLVISTRADKTAYRKKALPELISLGVRVFDVVYPEKIEETFGKFDEYHGGRLHFFTFSDSHEAGNTGRRFSEIDLPLPAYGPLVERLTKN